MAEQLEEALRTALPGRREAASVAFGQERGITLDTLREYSAGRRHLAVVAGSDPSLAAKLRSAPVDAIAILTRWHSYDPSAALNAARTLAEGGFSVQKLRKYEKLARPDGRAGTTPKSAFLTSVRAQRGLFWASESDGFSFVDWATVEREYAEKGTGDWWAFLYKRYSLGGAFSDPSSDERRYLRIDLIAGSNEQRVAILLVGPYNLQSTYSSRCSDWLLKATGVANFYTHVALILPRNCRVSPFVRWQKFASEPDANAKIDNTDASILLVRERPDGTFAAVGPSDDKDEEGLLEEDIIEELDSEHG